jgi:hypothetical protein
MEENPQGAGEGVAANSADGFFEPAPERYGQGNEPIRRFSETTLQRGVLGGAAVTGPGTLDGPWRMVLFSRLKPAVGQPQPKNFRQRKLFESGASAKRDISGRQQARVIFNKGEADSAVGLVVEQAWNSRRTAETLAAFASGENVLPVGNGAETLRKIYPFLTDTKERELLVQYKNMLAETEGKSDSRQRILQRAIAKAQAVIDKKQQQRHLFIRHLNSIAEDAAEILAIFEPDLAPSLTVNADEQSPLTQEEPEPPEDNPEGDAPDLID